MREQIGLLEFERNTDSNCRLIRIRTEESLQFVDLTDQVKQLVAESGITDGIVNVQTRHTTAAILVNEHEPLLLDDMKRLLERLVPEKDDYQHDNFEIRTANLTPDERRNGYSHCRALFLHASECLNLFEGALQLGVWQRIFLLELDGPRDREISIMILGH